MERRIRKVVSYVCTTCYQAFPDHDTAKAHWREAHHVPEPKRPRGRPPKEETEPARGKGRGLGLRRRRG